MAKFFVGKLNSSLYGIKQAAYEFYKILRGELEEQGFIRCEVDHAVFFFHRNGVCCLLAWHVDDGMAGSNNASFLDETKRRLHVRFSITDMGAITKYLGIQFERDRTTRELWIHQADYTCHLLDEYGLSNCHPILLPMDPNHPFLRDEDAAKLPEIPDISSLYPKLIGELLYLSVCARLDIAHAVQRLSQHLSRPTPRLFATAKRVLRYLAVRKRSTWPLQQRFRKASGYAHFSIHLTSLFHFRFGYTLTTQAPSCSPKKPQTIIIPNT